MSKTTGKAQQHGWRSHSEFEQFLMNSLIPDLRESEMTSLADDFETALYYMRHRA
jgi:hypothetical protein